MPHVEGHVKSKVSEQKPKWGMLNSTLGRAARILESKLTESLRDLNMPSAAG